MAGASLFTLIDDIATLLDDVSTMTKVAVEKTAGVLGDDLALNAYQVSGVSPNRELPVVWAVAKGSLVNKAILVPLALVISSFAEQAVMPMLMIGGVYLCYEGVEKLVHRWLHGKEESKENSERLLAVSNAATDMVLFEKERITGAIRTDFVLSAEIIVISLATVAKQHFIYQVGVLVAISLIMTCGVYGLVGGIVKLDDLGLELMRREGESLTSRFCRWVGQRLIRFSPYLLKFLSIAGTVAMFLVGGGIIVHGVPWLHHGIEYVGELVMNAPFAGSVLRLITTKFLDLAIGVISGAVVLMVVHGCGRLFRKREK